MPYCQCRSGTDHILTGPFLFLSMLSRSIALQLSPQSRLALSQLFKSSARLVRAVPFHVWAKRCLCMSALCNASAYPLCTPLLFAVTMRINTTLRPSVSTLFNAKVRFAAALRIGSVLIHDIAVLYSSSLSHRLAGLVNSIASLVRAYPKHVGSKQRQCNSSPVVAMPFHCLSNQRMTLRRRHSSRSSRISYVNRPFPLFLH